jgi:hypothetical protein
MAQADREQYDYRPTVDERFANIDLLLNALQREHGEPRYDIPPQLVTHHKRKLWEQP